jgi:hypothetical protein
VGTCPAHDTLKPSDKGLGERKTQKHITCSISALGSPRSRTKPWKIFVPIAKSQTQNILLYYEHMLNKCKVTPQLKSLILLTIPTVLLFLSFYKNTWKVADPEWFQTHELFTESWVVARLVQSKDTGIFSYGGLTGWGEDKSSNFISGTEFFEFQYDKYLNKEPFEKFSYIYKTHPGGQAVMFGCMDKLLNKILALPQYKKLNLFYATTAMLTAVSFGLIALWFYHETGPTTYVVVVITSLLSQWITVFGKNLWWSLWAFYLPFIVLSHVLREKSDKGNSMSYRNLAILSFFLILIKCLFTGFEYITTALIMYSVPLVYYASIQKWPKVQVAKTFLAIVLGSLLAIITTVGLLSFQIGQVTGNPGDGIAHVRTSLSKRSYGKATNHPEKYTESLEAPLSKVLFLYLSGIFLDGNNYRNINRAKTIRYVFKIHYAHAIVWFLIATTTAKSAAHDKFSKKEREQLTALVRTTWYALLAPLSWFVIFKAHSYEHTHMNFIVWHMPFTIFGFALCGKVLEVFVRKMLMEKGDEVR